MTTAWQRYDISVGGSVEESAKSQASVAAVFPITAILMLTVLMIQMQNFKRLFLVLSVAPLGLIGVVLALPCSSPWDLWHCLVLLL